MFVCGIHGIVENDNIVLQKCPICVQGMRRVFTNQNMSFSAISKSLMSLHTLAVYSVFTDSSFLRHVIRMYGFIFHFVFSLVLIFVFQNICYHLSANKIRHVHMRSQNHLFFKFIYLLNINTAMLVLFLLLYYHHMLFGDKDNTPYRMSLWTWVVLVMNNWVNYSWSSTKLKNM